MRTARPPHCDPQPIARVKPLPSGKFRVVVYLGPHPMTRKPIRVSRTFATEFEALAFRDAMLEEQPNFLERLRQRSQVAALPCPPGRPEPPIYLIRGQRVLLDADLARLFGTRTGHLNQAVSRNQERFSEVFAFRLTPEEVAGLRSLGALAPPGYGGRRSLPRVFTGLGLVMLAAVLKSSTAVKLNIEIVRTVCAAGQTLEPPAQIHE